MTGLVLLSGENLLGRSRFRRFARLAVNPVAQAKAMKKATVFSLNPAAQSRFARKNWRKAAYLSPTYATYKAGQAVLGEHPLGDQVLGRSFAKRMSSRVRGVTHAALNVATKIPVYGTIAQGIRSAGSMIDNATQSDAGKMVSDATDFLNRKAKQAQAVQAANAPKLAGFPYLKVGGGALVGVGLLAFVLSRKKRR